MPGWQAAIAGWLGSPSRPRMGLPGVSTRLAMSGLSWFGVDVISSPPPGVATSHAHPLPKRPAGR